jgi:hypothetical protein
MTKTCYCIAASRQTPTAVPLIDATNMQFDITLHASDATTADTNTGAARLF